MGVFSYVMSRVGTWHQIYISRENLASCPSVLLLFRLLFCVSTWNQTHLLCKARTSSNLELALVLWEWFQVF